MESGGFSGKQQLPFLKPAAVLASSKPHGTRIRYVGGCRCLPCRAANSSYECERARMRKLGLWNGIVDAAPALAHILKLSRRLWNGIVDAAPALAHILKLSRRGIGRNSVSRAAGVSVNVICKIRSGERTRIRAMTAKRILELGAGQPPKSQLVSSAPIRRMIAQLLLEGFTKAELAKRLGCGKSIQFGVRQLTTRRALERMKKFYSEIMAE